MSCECGSGGSTFHLNLALVVWPIFPSYSDFLAVAIIVSVVLIHH